MRIGCSDISDITMGIEKSNHQILHKKISPIMIAEQAGARHFWVFLSTNILSPRLAKEGRKSSELERKMLENYSTPHGIRYFVYLSWTSPCWEQMLAIGTQAMNIACNGGAVANRLRRRTSDQTVLGSNPAVPAALSPWTRLFTPIVPRRSLHISFY